jgi:hypothetical protein
MENDVAYTLAFAHFDRLRVRPDLASADLQKIERAAF